MTVHPLATPSRNGHRSTVSARQATADQQPPHNVVAEESVLGAAMLATHATDWLLANLRAEHFYRPSHRTIYDVIAQLATDGAPVDATTVAAALQGQGQLADVGGHPFLLHLIEQVPAASSAGFYGRIVRDLAKMRRLLDLGTRITQLGYELDMGPERAAALAQAWVDELTRDGEEIGLRPEDLLEAIRDRQRARTEGRVASWGIEALDTLTEGGLFGGDLVILAALTSMGKSSLAIQVAAHNAEAGHVLYATYEMTPDQAGKHTFAGIAGKSLSEAAAFLDSESMAGAREAHNQLDLTVFKHQPDAARLVHEVRSLHARSPLRLVVVDYLQKIPPPAGVRYGTRAEAVADISRLLKALALGCDVPLIAVAQLNRAANAPDREPDLSHLRESGAIEQDADQVLFIHKERNDVTLGLADLILAKNRMGPRGKRTLRWHPQQAVFGDL